MTTAGRMGLVTLIWAALTITAAVTGHHWLPILLMTAVTVLAAWRTRTLDHDEQRGRCSARLPGILIDGRQPRCELKSWHRRAEHEGAGWTWSTSQDGTTTTTPTEGAPS